MVIEYFTKWAESIPLRKATGGAIANFIKENITEVVRKMLEFYQVRHHWSLPYYSQGNDQVEATNKTLIKIIGKISQEYSRGRVTYLPDALHLNLP